MNANYMELTQNDDIPTLAQKINLNFKQLVFSLTQEMNRRSNKESDDNTEELIELIDAEIENYGYAPGVGTYVLCEPGSTPEGAPGGSVFSRVGTITYTKSSTGTSETLNVYKRTR